MMEKLTVIKVGGKVIEDPVTLKEFTEKFKLIPGKKILVHGGGVMADKMLQRMGMEPKKLDGRRITDEETLDTVVMVYGGLVNKGIVGVLQGIGVSAVGVTGMDGGSIVSTKRPSEPFDYGFAGDVQQVNTTMMNSLMHSGYVPVIAPITGTEDGQLLNTNADTIASEVAKAFSDQYEVELIYGFEIDGVLEDINDTESLIHEIKYDEYQVLKEKQQIHSGMIPKLDNAFGAKKFVSRVIIGNYIRVNEISLNTTEKYTKLST